MKISSNFSTYFGMFTCVLLLIANSPKLLNGTMPESWATVVVAWSGLLGAINSAILTGMHAFAGPGTGPLASAPTVLEAHDVMTEAKKAAAVLVGVLLALLLLGEGAQAQGSEKKIKLAQASSQTPRPRPPVSSAAVAAAPSSQISKTEAQTNPLLALRTFTVTDLQAALDDANAQSPPDKVAAQCYAALIPLVQSNVANPLPKGLGGFQLLQKLRDAKSAAANIQSPSGPLADLNIACAPLVLDVQNTLIQLGILGGGVAASGGLTLPIALPALLPFHFP